MGVRNWLGKKNNKGVEDRPETCERVVAVVIASVSQYGEAAETAGSYTQRARTGFFARIFFGSPFLLRGGWEGQRYQDRLMVWKRNKVWVRKGAYYVARNHCSIAVRLGRIRHRRLKLGGKAKVSASGFVLSEGEGSYLTRTRPVSAHALLSFLKDNRNFCEIDTQ
jgi:hypothetical protein